MSLFRCGHDYDANKKRNGRNRNGKPSFRCRRCHAKQNARTRAERDRRFKRKNRERYSRLQAEWARRNRAKLAYKWRVRNGWSHLKAQIVPLRNW